MPELTFTLTHDRRYYRDLFHHDDFYFFTKNASRRIPFYMLLAFTLFTLIAWFINVIIPSVAWLVPIGITGILGASTMSAQVLFKYLSWKFYVHKYSRQLAAHAISVLCINEQGLKIINGREENEFPWDHFDLAKISDNYIILTNKATSSLVIPAECLPAEEFKALNRAIRNHVNF